MTSQRPEWSEEQHVYAASGGKERRRAVCICSQWRWREAKSSMYMQPVEAKRGKEQCVYAASGGEEKRRAACICSQWRRREVKSSMYMQPMEAKSSVYALNECGVLISKGLSPSYNEQGQYESQIPSCTMSKDLEKQWLIAAWEICACRSFKFFGRVSRSHCDRSDRSPLRVHHLKPLNLKSKSTLYSFIV